MNPAVVGMALCSWKSGKVPLDNPSVQRLKKVAYMTQATMTQ